MKKSVLLVFVITVSLMSNAQAPQSFAYQGVARNNMGNPIANQLISIRASILDSIAIGNPLYIEKQNVTTNALGLFSISIGTGTVQYGLFATIDWATDRKYMKVEFDPVGGTSYILSGTQQILSVPYALNALNAKTYVSGSGISVIGSTITNTAPNQTVTLVGAGSTSVTGTYPTYTVNTNISSALPKYITNVNLVSNTGASYTSLNCSSYIPVGAAFVILNVRATTNGNHFINFRKDAISPSLFTNSGISTAAGLTVLSNLSFTNSALIIPVDALRTFQYSFTGTGSGSLLIDLIGYY